MFQYIVIEHPYYFVTGALYAASAALYTAAWKSTKAIVARLGSALMLAALVANTGLVLLRWHEAGRAPFKSLFESLVFFALCIAIVYAFFELIYKTRVFGVPATLLALGTLVYAVVKWDAEIVKLPPALQSGWFVPHVMLYFVGYAAVAIAFILAVVQLLAPRVPFVAKMLTARAGTILTGQPLDVEKMSYDLVRFGFVMITAGLLVGSVWAASAWGTYWGWDPKENWSLVTWLIYGGYLHLRRVRGWRGDKGAWLLIIGFAVVMFTYLGMNMLPTAETSAHVYTS